MTEQRFRTSADATRFNQTERGRRLARAITSKRSDRLVRALREQLVPLREQSTDNPPARQFGYGLVELPTVRRFREIDSQGRLHQIHVIQGDIIDGVLAYIVDTSSPSGSVALVYPGRFPGQTDADTDEIFSGRFKNVGSLIRLFDGTQIQADPELVAQTSVDSQFIGQGLAYIWTRFAFQEGRFNGDPSIRVIARSRKIVDPRDSLASPGLTFDQLPKTFSINPYRMIFDYLIRPVVRGGAGVPLSQLNAASFSNSADWAEGIVDTQQFTRTALFTTRSNQTFGVPPVNTNHLLEFNVAVTPFQYGDIVRVSAGAGQTLPPNLTNGTDYHVIPVRHAAGDFQLPAVALADSLENALAGVSIAQGERLSDIQVTKTAEVRFQSGMSYLSGEPVLDRLLESCGARLYLDDGQIAITSQRFPSSVVNVPTSDLIGSVALSVKDDPDSRTNALSGTFTSLTNLFIPSTYPVVDGGGVFKEQDGGEELLRELNLPFAAKASVAQRLATIELRRRRQELSLAISGDLELYKLKPSTVFSLQFPRYGLDEETTFEVRDQTLFLTVSNDAPSFGVNIEARQLESTTFDLDITNEQFVDSANIPGLGSVFDVQPPGLPAIAESLFQTRIGAGVRSQVSLTWSASPDNFVTGYLVSFKNSNNLDFIFLAETPDTSITVSDLSPGFFDFQVQAINSLGLKSDADLARRENVQIFGLSDRPAATTNFLGQVVSSSSVLLTWDRSEDLDVREGGFVQIRHDPAISGAISRDSIALVQDVGGQTSATVPFKQGTYFHRFEDSTGQFSDAVSWSTQDRRPVEVAQDVNLTDIGAGGFTLQEDNTFPSSNVGNTLIFVTDHLELPLTNTVDDQADFDAIPDVDAVTGGDVLPEGLYFFQTSIELAAKTRVVLEAVLATEIFDLSASIDDEPDFDQIPDVDLVAAALFEAGAADAEMQVRFSQGTIASDTFGPWEKIDTGFFDARSYEFRIRARSFSTTANIRITQARVRMRAVPLG